MKRFLGFLGFLKVLRRYPLAMAGGGAVLAVAVGWTAYQGFVGRPAPAPPATVSRRAPSPPPAAPTPAKPPSPRTGPSGNPPTSPGGASSAAPGAPGTKGGGLEGPSGRADPFAPLIGGGGGGRQPGLPPVPSLSPEGSSPGLGAFRLLGLLGDGGALAIVADERTSYVVGPGDEIGPDIQVVRIDLRRGMVEVRQHGVREELTLQPIVRKEGGAQ